jgi:hypothetical protein
LKHFWGPLSVLFLPSAFCRLLPSLPPLLAPPPPAGGALGTPRRHPGEAPMLIA